MTQAATGATGHVRRGPGDKAGLDLAQILRVASDIAPADLTMQAVADRMGVDRKAVNHYVSDRKTLFRLVTAEAFKRSFLAAEISADGDWREGIRLYGHAIAKAVAALGPLAGEVRFSRPADAVIIRNVESMLDRLLDAGFSLEVGHRALIMLTQLSFSHGEGFARMAHEDPRAREAWLREVAHQISKEPTNHLSEMLGLVANPYDEQQLDLTIDIFIRGIEGMRDRTF
ncbi:hypothetical protein ACQPXT_34410 [Streptomyces sp. CA-100214]